MQSNKYYLQVIMTLYSTNQKNNFTQVNNCLPTFYS